MGFRLVGALVAASLVSPLMGAELIVKLRPGKKLDLTQKDLAGVQLQESFALTIGDFAVVRAAKSVQQKLQGHPAVEYVEENQEWVAGEVSGAKTIIGMEDRFGLLWGLVNSGKNEPDLSGIPTQEEGRQGADINALQAWRVTTGSKTVVVAIVDGGVDYKHPDLAQNMWVNPGEIPGNGVDDDGNGYVDDVHGWNARGNNGDPMDETGHGTHCAGTIGASHNDGGVSGVMQTVSLMAVKFIGANGRGLTADAIKGIDYAVRMKADVINNSWGGGKYSRALQDILKKASDEGIVIVSAAGNSASDNDVNKYYPAGYNIAGIISVANHTHTDALSPRSNYGNKTVHIAAPGKNILSTSLNGSYAVLSGTSMAAPHVAGAVGLLLAREGRMPHSRLKERLMGTSVPAGIYRRHTISGGRLDAHNLLTNTRPFRHQPDASAWESFPLTDVFESDHPYVTARTSKTYRIPGARYVRVVVERFDLEKNFDFLTVKDAQGEVVERITGKGKTFVTEFAVGDTVVLEFQSDAAVFGWGFRVSELQFIR
jgi:thermitase